MQKLILLIGIILFGGYSLVQSQPLDLQINGSASSEGGNCFTLTDPVNFQSGSVWNKIRVDLNQPFSFLGSIFLGCNDYYGADGIAFVFQGDSAVTSTAIAGGLGYVGIDPSLAIEFDTYQNGSHADPSADHVAILSGGSFYHNAATNVAGPVPILSSGGNAEDCNSHDLKISWDPVTGNLEIYVDCELRLTYQGDIVNNFLGGQSQVFWGITGVTGAYNNLQQFCIDEVTQSTNSNITCSSSTDFVLVNALNNHDIRLLNDGDVIDLATLPTNQLNIRADLDFPGLVSVRFGFQNTANYRIENIPPYALHGDTNGDYNAYTYTPGSYKVSATPSDRQNGKGNRGPKQTINFTIIDSNAGARMESDNLSATIYPNPAQNKLTLDLKNLKSGNLNIELYDVNGSLIIKQQTEVFTNSHLETISLLDLPSGMYMVRIQNGELVYTGKVLKQ